MAQGLWGCVHRSARTCTAGFNKNNDNTEPHYSLSSKCFFLSRKIFYDIDSLFNIHGSEEILIISLKLASLLLAT